MKQKGWIDELFEELFGPYETVDMKMDIFPGAMIPEPHYGPKEFIADIMQIGKTMYVTNEFETVKEYIYKKLETIGYSIVQREGRIIVIAFPQYIPNAPEKISRKLGVIADIFIEVSGPESTVLILDCEKQWLRKKCYHLREQAWLA